MRQRRRPRSRSNNVATRPDGHRIRVISRTIMSTATAPRRRQRRTVAFCQAPGFPKMDIGSATDVGRVRETNEDSLLVMELGAPRQGQVVVCVADGMGGHNAGEVASALAVESV